MDLTPLGSWVLWAHLLSTWYMTGLIWFVQVVHYPLKSAVQGPGFRRYQQLHVERTGWVVGPPMLVEAATGAWLVLSPPPGVPLALPLIGITLLGLVWGATALFSVPAHGALARGFEADAHRRLVMTNWLRTFGWTTRGAVALALVISSGLGPR